MLLRPYQNSIVTKAKAALKKHRNTLVVGATGMGKTICLSALAREIGGRTLILQHRDELVRQNLEKFRMVNPEWRTSIYAANEKDFSGQAVFSMAQTLTRHTEKMPKFDHLIHDEVHHCAAPSFSKIIEACKENNPKLMISGFTATPERSDKKTLRRFFSNVADQVTIKELVGLGFLVPPRAFVVDLGVQGLLRSIQNTASNFGDQSAVADVLDTRPINDEVVRHWKEKANGRQTIVFCSTIQHAQDVSKSFNDAGVASRVITGDTPGVERKNILDDFDRGFFRVLCNVAVLTEGFDSQSVSCVILLRLCSDKGPLIQMVGRGLRTVDPELHPGVVKKDCIVLDFGTSLITHGDLDINAALMDEREEGTGEGVTKTCPEEYKPGMVYHFPDNHGNIGCGAEIPSATKTCPICGFVFTRIDGERPETVELMEIDLLNASPFRWCSLFDSDLALMASSFESWAGIFSPDGGDVWIALGGKGREIKKLAVTSRPLAIAAADDFMRATSDIAAVKKTKRWLDEPATDKQVQLLQRFGHEPNRDILGASQWSKYSASCLTNFHFNQYLIEKALGVAV